MPRDIMYVGRKPTKWDNKNDVRERVWHGLGQVVTGISEMEANKLCEHPDIWMDVTGLKKNERADIIAKYQDKYAEERRRDRAGQVLTLDTATDDELEAALRQRRAQRGKPQVNAVDDESIPRNPKGPPGSQSRGEREDAERPENSQELASDVFGVLASLDPQKDFDSTGKPYLERVNEKLGYEISQQELDDIYQAYKG